MEIQVMPLESLNPAPYNPRKDLKPTDPEFEKLKASIESFGYVEPIIVNKRTGRVVGGHQRLKVLKHLGKEEAECVIVDLAESEEKALNVALNKVSGERDDEKLDALMKELAETDFDITLTGFDAKELEKMFGEDVTIKEDTPPEVATTTDTKQGDLFILGDHRVLCGDSTKVEDVERLINGEKMDLMITDPPYGVDYEGTAGKIENDNLSKAELEKFLTKAFKNANLALKKGGSWYIFYADAKGECSKRAAEASIGETRQVLIWVKSQFTLSRQDYQWQHEPCLYGWTSGAGHYFTDDRDNSTVIEDFTNINKLTASEAKRMLKDILNGGTPTTVIREDKPTKNPDHPTMKPVKLIARFVRNSSRPQEKIIDLFGGSGSTLMAAEQLGRKAYIMEYDPKFVDVIVKRWEAFTGKKAEKEQENV